MVAARWHQLVPPFLVFHPNRDASACPMGSMGTARSSAWNVGTASERFLQRPYPRLPGWRLADGNQHGDLLRSIVTRTIRPRESADRFHDYKFRLPVCGFVSDPGGKQSARCMASATSLFS